MFKVSFCALALFLASQVSFAADYYVSNAGNDSSGGGASAPWASLQYAADRVAAGDTVHVLPGNYTGCIIYSDHSGTATSRISFLGGPGVNITTAAKWGDGIDLEGASYITVDGFTANGMSRAGVRSTQNTGAIIRNCHCDSDGTWGIFTGHSESILIENNECSRAVQQHGIYFSNTADNPIIRNNILWGNSGNGLHMNGDMNVPPGDGIISYALVENNIIYDNGRGGGSGINMCGVQDSVIRNNLVYNSHASGISMYLGEGAEACKRDLVYNNTILVASDGRSALNIKSNPGGTGNQFFNNILYAANSSRDGISDDGSNLDYVSDNNIVVDRMMLDGANHMSLATWQSQTGKDQHSIAVNATSLANLFVNMAGNDYRLRPGSLAVNAGTTISGELTDLAGTPRPVGVNFDIGAYECILPGDANYDGKVSFADYISLEQNFGKQGGWTAGDFTGDGTVKFADYLILEQGFGKSIPEPATLTLLAGGLLGLLRRKGPHAG